MDGLLRTGLCRNPWKTWIGQQRTRALGGLNMLKYNPNPCHTKTMLASVQAKWETVRSWANLSPRASLGFPTMDKSKCWASVGLKGMKAADKPYMAWVCSSQRYGRWSIRLQNGSLSRAQIEPFCLSKVTCPATTCTQRSCNSWLSIGENTVEGIAE